MSLLDRFSYERVCVANLAFLRSDMEAYRAALARLEGEDELASHQVFCRSYLDLVRHLYRPVW